MTTTQACHRCGNEVAPNDYTCPHCHCVTNGGTAIKSADEEAREFTAFVAEQCRIIDEVEQSRRCEGCGSPKVAGRSRDNVPLCAKCGRTMMEKPTPDVNNPGGALGAP